MRNSPMKLFCTTRFGVKISLKVSFTHLKKNRLHIRRMSIPRRFLHSSSTVVLCVGEEGRGRRRGKKEEGERSS